MATIAVDFDGTICTADGYPYVGEEVPHAVRVLKRLSEKGHRLVLWTCRQGIEIDRAMTWLALRGVDVTLPDAGTRKIICDVFVDDRNLGVHKNLDGTVDWQVVEAKLTQAGIL